MTSPSVEQLDPKQFILIKGARLHNLRSVDVAIPRNKLVVITGLSGSGKSTLAFDTLYAEGQRRYVESLSSYARQFLGRLDKPEVDWIRGISPAIAIEQKVISRNPRSTVGTSTEIYDYLKVLYARIGRTFSPESGQEVKKHEVRDVVDAIRNLPEGTRYYISAPLELHGRPLKQQLELLHQQGFSRVFTGKEVLQIADLLNEPKALNSTETDQWQLVIDRAVAGNLEEDHLSRLADSIQTAFFEGQGTCYLQMADKPERQEFSNRFEADGMVFEEPSLHLFSFNNPYGACTKCEGFGSVIGIDEDLVIPDPAKSIYEDAVVAWKGEKMQEWKMQLVMNASKCNFPIHKPYLHFTEEEKETLWNGNKYFKGIYDFFNYIESKSYKIQYRVMLSRYRGKTVCPSCKGTRLRTEASYVKIGGHSLPSLVNATIDELVDIFNSLELSTFEKQVAKRLLLEIRNRLGYLQDVGLGYLTLNRVSSTLSGGESQRINLATSLGSSLVGSMYILDEPSIGLHSRDTDRLIGVLKKLRDLGNTVIVVEHDEDIIRAADHLIDIGPDAGRGGGTITFSGPLNNLPANGQGYTGAYLRGDMEITIPSSRRSARHHLTIKGARENNLRGIDVSIPLGVLTAVTGVSGSGKTSLIKRVLYPALLKRMGGFSGEKTGRHEALEGAVERISQVEMVDQNPIGKSSRSNPVTYIKAYDDIRNLFAEQGLSKSRGYKTRHFSFNVEGGRCETCQGEGTVTIEMQFMADVHLKCESCHGKRFKDEVLEVKYKDLTIHDVLEMTVDEAVEFFRSEGPHKIADKLKPLQDVGLGYVQLGQSSSTLSGGEAQRIKLATFLGKGQQDHHTLFIFDEPTTGLHFHDIKKLMESFNALISRGHSILVIEHHPDVIKCADWVIDLGPEAGKNGGELVFAGTPEDLVKHPDSHTGHFLKSKFVK